MSSGTLGEHLARAIQRDAGLADAALLRAFASIPRERFLGPPPWQIVKPAHDGAGAAQFEQTSDLAVVYSNVSVALDADRQLFNGAPAVAATWLNALHITQGESALHLGCGTGYFTAILSMLVGDSGTVVAIEIDNSLRVRAGEALADYRNVTLLDEDALSFEPSLFDACLVSLGVSEIPEPWLSRMSPTGGRLVVTLGVPFGEPSSNLMKGLVFLIERFGNHYTARVMGFSMIFAATGHRAQPADARLLTALQSGSAHEVQSLRRDDHEPSETCWLHQGRYCLSRLARP